MIRGYTAIVNEAAYGLPVTAFVHIRLRQHTREVVATFENRIRAIDAILDCYVLTGEADYLLRVLVESLQDYEQFVRGQLHAISGIVAIDTSFAYGVVKRSTVSPAWDENRRSPGRRREAPPGQQSGNTGKKSAT